MAICAKSLGVLPVEALTLRHTAARALQALRDPETSLTSHENRRQQPYLAESVVGRCNSACPDEKRPYSVPKIAFSLSIGVTAYRRGACLLAQVHERLRMYL